MKNRLLTILFVLATAASSQFVSAGTWLTLTEIENLVGYTTTSTGKIVLNSEKKLYIFDKIRVEFIFPLATGSDPYYQCYFNYVNDNSTACYINANVSSDGIGYGVLPNAENNGETLSRSVTGPLYISNNKSATKISTNLYEFDLNTLCGSSGQYFYVSGWEKKFAPEQVTVYVETKFTITWKNYDGSILKARTVEYGITPGYNGVYPTRPANAQFVYSFIGWEPEIVPATCNATYIAKYDSIPNDSINCFLAYGQCGSSLNWTLSCDSTLTITGTGNMYKYNNAYSPTPWSPYKEIIKKVYIAEGVNNISSVAFYDCVNLTSVTVPASLTEIGNNAFYHCTSLETITLPVNVTSIGDNAFRDCINLTSITIPASLTDIGSNAFHNCVNLEFVRDNAAIPQNISSFYTNNTFGGVNLSVCTLYIPCGSLAAYQTANVWQEFGNIIEDCQHIVIWKNYDSTVLKTDTIPNGVIPEYTDSIPTKPATTQYAYTFVGWTPEVVPVTEDAIYTAKFDSTMIIYNVDVTIPDSIEGQGSVTVEGSTTFGDTITLTPVPEDGYYFVEWSDGNTENPREIIVTGDTIIYPIFVQCEEIIVTFTEVITKGESFDFAGMTLMQRGTYMDTTVLANGCDSITVLKLNVVKAKTFNLRVVVNEENMGTVEGAGTFTQGQEVTITATPASSKYVFVRWYNEDEDINVYENPYTFTLNRNLQIRAVFRRGKK